MNLVEQALPNVVNDLHALGVPWALVGGLAVCARAEPRPTADIDVAVAVPDDATAEALVANLIAVGYRWRESILHDETGRLATVRLFSAAVAEEVAVDLFFASSGVESEVVGAAELLDFWQGLTVPVACIGHQIAVKLCWRANEKRDRDLRVLIERMNAADLEDARHLIALITVRGYNHGRDLSGALDSWVSGSTKAAGAGPGEPLDELAARPGSSVQNRITPGPFR